MTVAATGKYTEFDDAPESTHNIVLSLIAPGARVLEFGCATGYMSAVLRSRLGCSVTAIEVDPTAAALARGQADRVIEADVESLDYAREFGAERFDVLLFADVLEHLRDPQAVLRRVRPLLAPGGVVVASIPNVAHGSVRVALLEGEFRYTPIGLLDDSHLRFFTRESVTSLFEDAGFVISDWLRKWAPIDGTEVVVRDASLAESLREPLEADPEATTYQFVVRARRAEDVEGDPPVRAELGALRAEIDGRDAAIRGLQAQLAKQTEVGVETARQVDQRDAAIRELEQSLQDRHALRRDLSSIRKLLRAQSAQLDALAAQAADTAMRQKTAEKSLDSVHQDLLLRQDDVHATLYELRATVAALRTAPATPDAAAAETQVEYQRVIRRVQETVRRTVPRGVTVVVVSRGDDALLSLYGRETWHFPRAQDGSWAGEYPATSTSAIAQLESLRALGAEFLLFPQPALWWLAHYAQLKHYLDHRYTLLLRRENTGALYDLRQPVALGISGSNVWNQFEDVVASCRARLLQEPAILDWDTGLDLAASFPLLTVFAPRSPHTDALPYIDASVNLVALASNDPELQLEARRVASTAVLTFSRIPGTADQHLKAVWLDAPNPLSGPASPTVSVVIPCFNQVAYTKACLRAVQETLPRDLDVEIIVVDDGSTDTTAGELEDWTSRFDRFRIVRNPENVGFIASCNRGAEVASGDLLVFLNNDTLPLAGWLEAIVRTFRDRPDAGAVGGKLLYPDGRLQEAGGVVFADGSAANVGRGEYDVELPLFNFVREVDYCSGALLATPRALFAALGGFDARYTPAYYEDTDYCFTVRAHGERVYYQPRTVIVHREGASSGTDPSTGAKRYQSLNQAIFAKKWAAVLSDHPRRPSTLGMSTWRQVST